MSEIALRFTGVTKNYGHAAALHDVSFEVARGEFFGLVPATFSCVFVSALGDRTATLKGTTYLAAGVTFFGVLLFSYVLKIPFPMFRWGH